MKSVNRRKGENGYPRGEETKANIINTAIGLFGEKGFAGVSTREIASAAGVPAPSLQYYFGNKEGLYQACIESIQDSAWEAIGPVVTQIEASLSCGIEGDALLESYCRILDALADFLFAEPDAATRALFIAQHKSPGMTNASKSAGKSATGKRIRECCAAIVSRISDQLLADEEIGIICTAINGQLIVVHLARDHVEDMMGWKEITSEKVDSLKAIVRRHTKTILDSYRTEQQKVTK